MNESSQPQLSTRRSFIKKSIVASVAVSSMTIFSGLVNAQNFSPSPSQPGESCSLDLVWLNIPNHTGEHRASARRLPHILETGIMNITTPIK